MTQEEAERELCQELAVAGCAWVDPPGQARGFGKNPKAVWKKCVSLLIRNREQQNERDEFHKQLKEALGIPDDGRIWFGTGLLTVAKINRDRLESAERRVREAKDMLEHYLKCGYLPHMSAVETEQWLAALGLQPLPMVLNCPGCGTLHLDAGEWATRPHKTHECQNPKCKRLWKPFEFATVGVAALGQVAEPK